MTEVERSAPPGRVRQTRQAAAIEDVLREADGFRTAQELHDELRHRGDRVGLTTVYRHLNLLVEHHLADVVHRGDGESQYRLCGTASSPVDGHHHHIVCRSAGAASRWPARRSRPGPSGSRPRPATPRSATPSSCSASASAALPTLDRVAVDPRRKKRAVWLFGSTSVKPASWTTGRPGLSARRPTGARCAVRRRAGTGVVPAFRAAPRAATASRAGRRARPGPSPCPRSSRGAATAGSAAVPGSGRGGGSGSSSSVPPTCSRDSSGGQPSTGIGGYTRTSAPPCTT